MTIRIGHLTDIHVAEFSDLRRTDFFGKRGTGWFNYTHKRADEYDRHILDSAVYKLVREAPDLVVVSGDLSNLGLASELRAALGVLEPLREANIRTIVIPGNHDYYTPQAAGGQFERICVDWQQADARCDGAAYPFVVRTGPVSTVCFNSGVPTPPIMAYGIVDDEQIARARRLVRAESEAGQAIVFAVHHHPTRAPHRKHEWHRGLRNVARFRKLAAHAGATAVFHGHNHYFHQRRLREANEVCVLGLSSATTNRELPAARAAQVGLYEVGSQGLVRAATASWDVHKVLFDDWKWVAPEEIPIESEHEALTGGPQV